VFGIMVVAYSLVGRLSTRPDSSKLGAGRQYAHVSRTLFPRKRKGSVGPVMQPGLVADWVSHFVLKKTCAHCTE